MTQSGDEAAVEAAVADGAVALAEERLAALRELEHENGRLRTVNANLETHLDRVKEDLQVEHQRLLSKEQALEVAKGAIKALKEQLKVRDAALEQVGAHPEPWTGEPGCRRPHVERQRLPDDRVGMTFKLRIGVEERLCESCGAPLPGSRSSAHLTLNAYPDGRMGEMFLSLDRHRRGEPAATFAHEFAIAVSIGLQHGIPWEVYAQRMRHVRDDSGGVAMREVNGKIVPCESPRVVGSLVDLIAVTMERFGAAAGAAAARHEDGSDGP